MLPTRLSSQPSLLRRGACPVDWNDPARNRTSAKLYRLLRLMWEAWRAMPGPAAALFARTILLAAAAPAFPWAMGRLVDALGKVQGSRDFGPVVPWVLVIVAIRLASSALNQAGGWFEAQVQQAQVRHVLHRVLGKTTRVPLQRYEAPGFHDSLARTAGDFAGYQMHDLFWRSVAMLQGVFTLGGLAWVAGRGDAVAPVLILAVGLMTMVVPWRIGVEWYALQRAMSGKTRLLQYMLSLVTTREAAKEVRLFGLGPYLLDRWQDYSDQLRRRTNGYNNRGRLAQAAVDLLPLAAVGAAVVLVLLRAQAGGLSVGGNVAAFYALLSLQERWDWLSGRFSEIWGWYLRAIGDLTA